MAGLPDGTVTFLFSDVEGSTQLLERHGAALGAALARHHELFAEAVDAHDGVIFETVGDAVYAAFSRPASAVAAALAIQEALGHEDWGRIGHLAVRIALHTGSVERRGTHYFGAPLFRAARLLVLGHGEQTLMSATTAALVKDVLPDTSSLRDLGVHRLKDLGAPEQVHQLVHPRLRADFPALRSLDAHPHNLPAQLSSFVGRNAELGEVARLLAEHRLVTLLGPGGIGKTRLALQAAADQLEHFPDGVFFIDVAPLRDPELVPGAVASPLGLREQPGTPIATALTNHLRHKQLLLVLDNIEQVLPAAAMSIGECLAAAPKLSILATSRAPLRLRGEQEYLVPPLAVGDPERLEVEPPAAVQLFLERAQGIRSDFAIDDRTGPLVAAICARLDGLPLAIELAAARLRVFNLQQLHERLTWRLPLLAGGARDAPERQQTLRATIAWSTGLLAGPQRRLFARLGVFVGGFTLEAAEAVAGPGLEADVLDALTTLVEHSLVRLVDGSSEGARYGMLETIREAALEELEASGEEEEIRNRHVAYFLAFSSRHRWRTAGDAWRAAMVGESNNLRAALEWATAGQGWPQATALAAATWQLWSYLGMWREGLSWTEAALTLARPDDQMYPEVLHAQAVFMNALGRRDRARAAWSEALRLWRVSGDLWGQARALHALGMTSTDVDEAVRLLEEALAAETAAGELTSVTRYELAGAVRRRGELQRATELYHAALADALVAGDDDIIGSSHFQLAQLALASGDLVRASQHALEARQWSPDELGDQASGWALAARLALRSGDSRKACEALGEAVAVLTSGEWEHKAVFTFDVVGEVMAAAGDGASAALMFGKSESLKSQRSGGWPADQRRECERLVSVARSASSPEAFAAAWQRGSRPDTTTGEVLAFAKDWLSTQAA